MIDAGNFGGRDRHDGRGDVRISAAGDITPRRLHRNKALSGVEAIRQLDLELAHTVELRLGEVTDPRVGELDIAFELFRYFGSSSGHVCR